MIKLVSKFGMSSGVVTSACFINVPSNNTNTIRPEKTKLDEVKKRIDNIAKLEDIEIFERANGCSFAFVGRWDYEEVYKFEKFLKSQEKRDEWESKVVTGANSQKEKCKSNRSVALFHSGSQFQLDPSRLNQ